MSDRTAACLLGLAWGDVLGCPVEYWTAEQIRSVHGRYGDLPAVYPWDRFATQPELLDRLRPLGLYSDDTQQAASLLHACLSPGGWHVDGWARLLSRGAKQKAWRGTGANFRAAVKRFEAGTPPLACGMPSAGIGSAMRAGPLGPRLHDDRELLRRVVLESTLVTHADLRSASAAYAVAACCAALAAGADVRVLRGGLAAEVDAFEAQALRDRGLPPEIGASLAAHRGIVPQALAALLPVLDEGLPALRERLIASAAGHGIRQADRASLVNHPFVLLGGMHALGAGLADDVAPAAMLADVVSEGGDADTVGAIAGALLGARFGAGWIPPGRVVDAALLARLAAARHTDEAGESADEFLRREAALSSIERRHARALHDPATRDALQHQLDLRRSGVGHAL